MTDKEKEVNGSCNTVGAFQNANSKLVTKVPIHFFLILSCLQQISK